MKRMSLVSVIIPTHNRSLYLTDAVKSILSQSHSNWELIIIADACTDNTKEVIAPYLVDDRIYYLESKDNIGGAAARNRGLDLAKGDYVSFLDDDDIWGHNKIKIQLEFLQNNPSTKLVYCNFNQLYESDKKRTIILTQAVSLEDLLVTNLIGSFSFVMVEASELKNIRIDENLRSSQDWDLWTKVLRNSNSLAQNCDANLVDYRMQGQDKISENYDILSKGYERWYLQNEYFMNDSLKSFHRTIISIYKEEKMLKYKI